MTEPNDAFQWPKPMAPTVKMKTIVPIQMKMAAVFSELIGVGVMTYNHNVNNRFLRSHGPGCYFDLGGLGSRLEK